MHDPPPFPNHSSATTALFLVLLLGLALGACRPAPEIGAETILARAAEAHGGQSAWERLDSLAFTKQTTLLREDGSIESSVTETQVFRWKPDLSATLSWVDEGNLHRIDYNQTGAKLTIGDSVMTDSSRMATAHRKVQAALYTVSQPFHLLHDREYASYEGLDTLPDGQVTHVVRMDYPGEASDTWWYFFDRESGRCIANLAYHAPTYAFIRNLSYAKVGPLWLHGKRETWRTDEHLNRQFLRARFVYSDYSISFRHTGN